MTIMHDPCIGMESSESTVGQGCIPFMAPELLVPSKFGLKKYMPLKEADIYAMGMVIYQVRTTRYLTYTYQFILCRCSPEHYRSVHCLGLR